MHLLTHAVVPCSANVRHMTCLKKPLPSSTTHTLLVAALVATLAPTPTRPSTPAAWIRGALTPPLLPPPAAAAAGLGATAGALAWGLGLGGENEKGLGPLDATGAAALGLGVEPKLKGLLLAGCWGAASAASFSRMPLLTLPLLVEPLVPWKDSSRDVEPVRASLNALSSWRGRGRGGGRTAGEWGCVSGGGVRWVGSAL